MLHDFEFTTNRGATVAVTAEEFRAYLAERNAFLDALQRGIEAAAGRVRPHPTAEGLREVGRERAEAAEFLVAFDPANWIQNFSTHYRGPFSTDELAVGIEGRRIDALRGAALSALFFGFGVAACPACNDIYTAESLLFGFDWHDHIGLVGLDEYSPVQDWGGHQIRCPGSHLLYESGWFGPRFARTLACNQGAGVGGRTVLRTQRPEESTSWRVRKWLGFPLHRVRGDSGHGVH